MLLKPRLSADIRREWRRLAGPEELDTQPVAAGGRLSVIIPCLNEEATIIPTLELLIERTSRLDLIAEIVVADSGSTDNTAVRGRGQGRGRGRVCGTGCGRGGGDR